MTKLKSIKREVSLPTEKQVNLKNKKEGKNEENYS